MVKTIALTTIQPCTDLQKMYQEPKQKRVQILKRLDLVDINVLHCKVVLDLSIGYCGNDGIYNYLYNEFPIQHSVIQGIGRDECQDLHNEEEITN